MCGPEEHRLAAQRRLQHVVAARAAPGCRRRTRRRRWRRAAPARRPCRARSPAARRRPARAGGSSLRRADGQPARARRGASTSRTRSGWRGASTSARSGKSARAARVSVEHGLLLAAVRAAGDPHRLARRAGRAGGARDRRRRPGRAARSCLTLPVTNTRSGGAPSAMIRRASSSDCMAKTVTSSSTVRHEAAHQAIAAERPIGEPAVGDHHGHAAAPRAARSSVRPELGLHADEERGIDGARRAAQRARQVEREEAMRRRRPRSARARRWAPVSVTVVMTSGSSGIDAAQPLDEGRGGDGLADGDRVHPAVRPSAGGVAAAAEPRAHGAAGTPRARRRRRATGSQRDTARARERAPCRRRTITRPPVRSAARPATSSSASLRSPCARALAVGSRPHRRRSAPKHDRAHAREGRGDQELVPGRQPPGRARAERQRHHGRAGERGQRHDAGLQLTRGVRAARRARAPRRRPARSAATSARSAPAPPRDDEPRTTSRPKRARSRATQLAVARAARQHADRPRAVRSAATARSARAPGGAAVPDARRSVGCPAAPDGVSRARR